MGFICWEELVFDVERVSCWMSEIARLPGALRLKAVLRTDDGWLGFNFAEDVETVEPTGYRRDSRVEVVLESVEFQIRPPSEKGSGAASSPPRTHRHLS